MDGPRAETSRRAVRTPLTADDLLDSVADLFEAYDRFRSLLSVWSVRAVQLRVTITLDGALTVDFPDDRVVDATITFSDRFGDVATEPGPVTWSVSDDSLAQVTPDPTDDKRAQVRALAGAGTFRVAASAGSLSGESEDLVITPGAAVAEAITVTLEPQ